MIPRPPGSADLTTGWVGTMGGDVLCHFFNGLAETRESAEERHLQSLGFGSSLADIPVLVDATEMRGLSKDAREFFGSTMQERTGPTAILVGNPVIRVVVQMFIVTQRPVFPMKVFNDPDAAMQWLRAPHETRPTKAILATEQPKSSAQTKILLAGWDPDQVLEHRTGSWCMGRDGVLRMVVDGNTDTHEDIQELLGILWEYRRTHGALFVLCDATRGGWIAATGRAALQTQLPEISDALAIVVGTPVSRMLSIVMLRAWKPHMEVQVFDDPEEALEWVLERQRAARPSAS